MEITLDYSICISPQWYSWFWTGPTLWGG